jgi:hypothetical protein
MNRTSRWVTPVWVGLVILIMSNPALSADVPAAPARASVIEGNEATASSHCPPFAVAGFSKATHTITADPTNWLTHIANAPAGAEVLLAPGIYSLQRYAVVFERPLTLRSASGNQRDVVIEGQGYGVNAEALMIMADDVVVADLTVRNVRDHAISIKEGFARSIIYNVALEDVGTQHIKGSRMGPNGLIACSSMGYSTDIAPGDYNGAIDLHGAVGWIIRDNYIYNIWGDGSGCVVDEDCGTYYPGGGPAILLWKDSHDNTVERNRIVSSFRGISVGLNTPYSGGVIRDNFIHVATPGRAGVDGVIEHDTGISLLGAENVIVEGNTVLLAGSYPGPIELQDTAGIVVRNNLVSAPVWNRGNSQYNDCANRSDEDCDSVRFGNIVLSTAVQQESALQVAVVENTQAGDDANRLNADNPSEPQDTGESLNLIVSASVQRVAEPVVDTPSDTNTSVAAVDELSVHLERLAEIEAWLRRAREERLRGWEERLRMKEERLRFMELLVTYRGSGSTNLLSERSQLSDSARLLNELEISKRLSAIESLLERLEQ